MVDNGSPNNGAIHVRPEHSNVVIAGLSNAQGLYHRPPSTIWHDRGEQRNEARDYTKSVKRIPG
jgi:hypothetical protein